MKTNMKTMLALAGMLALGATTSIVNAQDNGGSQNSNGPSGPPMQGRRPPVPAIVAALDANHDGVIDANEIANAPAALKSLDKNGDGKLTPDEFMGPRPQRPGGQGKGTGANPGGDDDNMPPGPPPGDAGGPPDGAPPGPPPGQQ
jgi:hypothetical protein